MALLQWESDHADVCRLLKRLRRHQDFVFAFLDYDYVPADNNHAEREIRPAVIMRKTCLCNRSVAGAVTQAILMSIYRTLKRRYPSASFRGLGLSRRDSGAPAIRADG